MGASTTRTGLYTGSFDPLTNGHVDVIRQAAAVCDRLVVAIGVHPGKQPRLSVDARKVLIEDACRGLLGDADCTLEEIGRAHV